MKRILICALFFVVFGINSNSALSQSQANSTIGLATGYVNKGSGVSALTFGLNVDLSIPGAQGASVGAFTESFVPDSSASSRDYQTLFGISGKYHFGSFIKGLWAGADMAISQYTDTYSASVPGRGAGHFTFALGPSFGYDHPISRFRFTAKTSYIALPFIGNRYPADVGRGTLSAMLGLAVIL